MRLAVLVVVAAGLTACGGGTTRPAASSTPAASDLVRDLLPVPTGFTVATGSGAQNGPLDAAGFDALLGTGSAAKLGFHDGATATYQQTSTGYTLQVELFRFAAAAGASDLATTVQEGVQSHTTPTPTTTPALGIPEGIEVDPTAAGSGGVATYGVIAVHGDVTMVLDYSASYAAANRTFTQTTAQLQDALLP
jgi:hypothetical protein